MTTLTFTVNTVGTPDADDKRAMMFLINEENARRTAANNVVPPPSSLITILPTSTAAERKSSYETILRARTLSTHVDYVKQSGEQATNDPRWRQLRAFWMDATEAQKDAVESALGAPVTP